MSVPCGEAGRPYVHGPASLETQDRQDLVEPNYRLMNSAVVLPAVQAKIAWKIGRGGLEMWIVTYGAGQDATAHIARCAW